jgi:hypothetical protein
MSWQAIDWAIRQTTGKAGRKLLLLAHLLVTRIRMESAGHHKRGWRETPSSRSIPFSVNSLRFRS